MRYHRYRYNYSKCVKQTGWDLFKYEKQGKKYYDILPSLYYKNHTNTYTQAKIIVRELSKLKLIDRDKEREKNS